MGDRCGMSISADSPSDETLNRGPLALLLRRQYEYEFPFGINIVQFSFFFSLRSPIQVQTKAEVVGSNGMPIATDIFVCFIKFPSLIHWCNAIHHHRQKGPTLNSKSEMGF